MTTTRPPPIVAALGDSFPPDTHTGLPFGAYRAGFRPESMGASPSPFVGGHWSVVTGEDLPFPQVPGMVLLPYSFR